MLMLRTALMSAVLVAVPAFAQGEGPVVVEGGVPTAIVSYADLDIGSASGLATLNGRISRAASNLCFEHTRKDIDRASFEARCFKSAMAGAKSQVDRALADRSLRLASNGSIKVAAR
jgi:UrcA family protein